MNLLARHGPFLYQHSTIGMVLLRRRVGTISLVCRELVILDRALQTAELFNLETLRLRKRSAAASERSHLAARAKASEVLNGSCAVADNYLRQLISAFKNFKRWQRPGLLGNLCIPQLSRPHGSEEYDLRVHKWPGPFLHCLNLTTARFSNLCILARNDGMGSGQYFNRRTQQPTWTSRTVNTILLPWQPRTELRIR